MDRRDHLVAQLAHAENDDGRIEVHVGGRAEHLAEAAVDPAMEDDGSAGFARQTVRDISENRLDDLVVGLANRTLDQRTFRFVDAAANAGAEVDRVGGRGTKPRFVAVVGGAEVEDVEGVAGAEGKWHVDATELLGEAAVFVLGIDDVDARAATESAHDDG